MSPYQTLCKTLEDTRGEWLAFKKECARVAEMLIQGFVQYLEVPEKRWRILPPDFTEETMHLPYDIGSALRLSDDGNWHFVLQIDLIASDGDMPTLQPMLFPIKINKKKMSDSEFEVCLAEKTCRVVHDGQPHEFKELFEAAYGLIVQELDQQLDTFLQETHTLAPRKIGFV